MATLEIKNLHVRVEGKEILKGVTLAVPQGEVHALMGPNGSGKSTLAYALLGHPRYDITSGSVRFDGQDVLAMPPNERAKLGLFLSFQYPVEVPGVSFQNFLRTAYNAVHGTKEKPVDVSVFRTKLLAGLKRLGMPEAFAKRSVNEGFSGGEKKRAEIVQLAVLEPKLAVLDETDSGLDVDALKVVAEGVNALRGPALRGEARQRRPKLGVLLITHYSRMLTFIKPDVVHVMVDGRIAQSGTGELAHEIEAKGYELVVNPVAV